MLPSFNGEERNANRWTNGSFSLEYTKMSKRSRTIEVWKFPDGPEIQSDYIDESEVPRWLESVHPLRCGQKPTAGLRLITQTNESGYPKFPMREETLTHLLREWKFPDVEVYRNAFYIGGSAVFLAGSGDDAARINFILGGGIFTCSIGGIFSHDCASNITSGYIISGKSIPDWTETIPTKFLELANPFTIPILIADILISTAMSFRRSFIERLLHIEVETGRGPGAEQRASTRPLHKTLPNYRALAVQVSEANRQLGLSQMNVERARLVLKFIINQPEALMSTPFAFSKIRSTLLLLITRAKFMLSTLEHMKAEQQNGPVRLQCQSMVVANLVAQQDVALQMEVARDSRELAQASRRDSSAMRVIAVLGTVFLPGTFTATVLALPLFKWDSSTTSGVLSSRLWIYFAITIPLTIITMAIMFFWLKRRERRGMELATQARNCGDLEGAQESQECKTLVAG